MPTDSSTNSRPKRWPARSITFPNAVSSKKTTGGRSDRPCVDVVLPQLWRMAFAMADPYVWILVIEIWGSWRTGERNQSSRTRDLPLEACLTLVQEVQSENTHAYCYETGTPDPGYQPWKRNRALERDPIRDCASHHYFRGSCIWPLPAGRRRI